jgi:pimeloyl-ACP methyl ester carboxylesterase
MTKTVVLVHGAWLTPASWDRFRGRYEAAGYTVVTPAWPYLDRTPAELRRAPNPAQGQLGIRQIVDHLDAIIRALPEPPIIMGHSFGGLFTQLLLDRGLGAAGVAIDPGPPFGVPAHPLAVWTSRKVFLGWATWNRAMLMNLDGFAEGFAQLLPAAEMKPAYERYIVPSPGRIFWQAVLGIGSKVRWDNPDRAPLLLTAGEFDRTVPAPMVRANYRKQLRAPSATAIKEFAGRSHFLCNEKGWEEVADYALEWAATHARTAPSVRAPAMAYSNGGRRVAT